MVRVCSRIALKEPTVATTVQKVDYERAATAGFRVSAPPRHSPPLLRGCLELWFDNVAPVAIPESVHLT